MSVSSEITRIQNARNILRTKEVALGIGVSTDNLTEIATNFNGITDQGTPSATVQEGQTYTIAAGYYHGGTVTGVPGGGSYDLQEKSAIPTKAEQVITPDSGKYGLSKVKVSPIPDAYQNVTNVTASAADVLATKIIVTSSGAEVAGTMPNRGAVSQVLDTITTSYTIPVGYHNGSGVVSVVNESKTATPTEASQTITPTAGKVLSSVTIGAIPDKYANAEDVTVTSANLLSGITAIGYNSTTEKAVTITGSMPNNGAVEPEGLDCGESYTIPAGYHNGSGVVTANSLASQTGIDTGKIAISAATVLAGTQGWACGLKISGTMPNNGAVTPVGLNCGQSYTIPAGYHNGSGTVTANSLASQTGTDTGKSAITAATVLTGYQGWVNGSKITGTMVNNGAISGTITGLGVIAGDTSYTIPAGYTTGGTVSLTNAIETALAAI